jgi:hypothetical protein
MIALLHGSNGYTIAAPIERLMNKRQLLPCTSGKHAMPTCKWFTIVSRAYKGLSTNGKMRFTTFIAGNPTPLVRDHDFLEFRSILEQLAVTDADVGEFLKAPYQGYSLRNYAFGMKTTNLMFKLSAVPEYCERFGTVVLDSSEHEEATYVGSPIPLSPLCSPVSTIKSIFSKMSEEGSVTMSDYETVCTELVLKATNRFITKDWIGLHEPLTVSSFVAVDDADGDVFTFAHSSRIHM